jgi:hypothetical protein
VAEIHGDGFGRAFPRAFLAHVSNADSHAAIAFPYRVTYFGSGAFCECVKDKIGGDFYL